MEHKKGIGILETNVSEEEIYRDIERIFADVNKGDYSHIHTLEVRPDDGSKPYFVYRDSIKKT